MLACTTHCYHGHPLKRALQGISRAGFHFIEIAAVPGVTEHVTPERMDAHALGEARRMVGDLGLEVVSISGHCDLTSPDGVNLFQARVEMARAWGVGFINTCAGAVGTEAGREVFFSALRRLLPLIADADVVVCLETDSGIIGPSEEILETIARIGSDRVKINFDPANVVYNFGRDPVEELRKIAPQVGHVHLKDKIGGQGKANFPAVGRGTIDFGSIFDALDRVDYAGPYSIEVEFDGKGCEDVERVDEAIAFSRKTVLSLRPNFAV